jgi:hypothetical protein
MDVWFHPVRVRALQPCSVAQEVGGRWGEIGTAQEPTGDSLRAVDGAGLLPRMQVAPADRTPAEIEIEFQAAPAWTRLFIALAFDDAHARHATPPV